MKSDEMSPTLEPGCTAVIDRTDRTINQTGVFLIRAGGVEILRRFRRTLDGSVRVSCDNSAKYPEVENLSAVKGIAVLGRVVSKVTVKAVR